MTGAALLALGSSCSHSNEPVQEPLHAAITRPAAPAPARTVLALPKLLALSVDELPRQLGPARPVPAPVQAQLNQLPAADLSDSTRYFHFRGLDMVVTYDAGTRRANDWLLLGPSEEVLMQRAGLSAEAAGYLVLPVFHMRHPMQAMGVRVVPVAAMSRQ